MNSVIGLFDPAQVRAAALEAASPTTGPIDLSRSCSSFTPRDLADLKGWSSDDRRVALCASEMGAFAMLYRDGSPWASWGLVRQDRSILVWDCVTLADLGRFTTVTAALGSLAEDDDEMETDSNIIIFAAAAARLRRNVEARSFPDRD